ncbi:MAG: DUF2804 family protein [Solirubrobacteraceae bacterium]
MVQDTRKRVAPNDRTDPRRGLPYRGTFGAPRPAALSGLPLPPAAMPSHLGTRPLKAWRYVGVFGPELMICVAAVRVGRARQSFWAMWDRRARRLHERTWLSAGGVELARGGARITDGRTSVSLRFEEDQGIEAVCPSGTGYAWTRKQGGIPATATVDLGDGRPHATQARAVIDDTAAYYERHTRWRWCAGVGTDAEAHPVAWNLVEGVNDPDTGSERTVWVDGVPTEVGPVMIAPVLDAVGELRFHHEATRAHRQNLVVVRSRYRQPFGTFSGTLPDGTRLAEGFGVMEDHDAWW